MGINRSKLFSKTKGIKHSPSIRSEKKCTFRRSLSADQEMLLSKRGPYNGYLMNDSIFKDLKCQFRVSHLDDRLKTIQKGYLGITTNELIFSHSENLSDTIFSWPLTTLRWYAYTHNMFIFQCGRKSPTGEGTFIFSCSEYQILKETFEYLMNENQLHSNWGNSLKPSRSNIHRQISAIEPRTETLHLMTSPLQFNRSQSMNAACHHSCVEKYSRIHDFSAMPNFRNRDDVSDLTSSESTVSSGTMNVSNILSLNHENYLTEVTNISIPGSGGEYLVAANVPITHGYVNQHNSNNSENIVQQTPNYINEMITRNYLNFPNTSNAQFLF